MRVKAMTILARTELNLSRVLREDVESADDLARVALEALDHCAMRLYRAGKGPQSEAITKARTELTNSIQRAFS
jgi:hypothetical protein